MAFLIVDLEYGCLDGWYYSRETAERIAEFIKETLGHNKVIVVEYNKDRLGGEDASIGFAFMAKRVSEIRVDPAGIVVAYREMEGKADGEAKREVCSRIRQAFLYAESKINERSKQSDTDCV